MKEKNRDNLIYLGVAGIVVAVGAFYIYYTDKTMGTIPDIPGSILWGAFSTPVVIALVLNNNWGFRHRPVLWLVAFAFGAINVVVAALAYLHSWNPPGFVWAVVTTLWVGLMLGIVNAALFRKR